jgi:hypothetical protein
MTLEPKIFRRFKEKGPLLAAGEGKFFDTR